VIDCDALAHRAHPSWPKTILRSHRRPSNSIVGVTNFLLGLWDSEQPRAVLVGWDTLEVPTYRHQAFESYQGGREFDDELLEQLALLPQLVEAFGFASAKAAGYEADDFLAAAVAAEEKRRGTAVVATSDRDSFQLASDGRRSSTGAASASSRGSVPPRCASVMASSRLRWSTSSRCAVIHPTACPERPGSGRRRRPTCCASTARSRRQSPQDGSPR
jgi:hypothetical protein